MRKRKKYLYKKNNKRRSVLLLEGILYVNSSGEFAFLTNSSLDKDVYIRKADFKTANHGDTVLCGVTKMSRGKKGPEGFVKKIIKRNDDPVLATVVDKAMSNAILKSQDKRFYHLIIVPLEYSPSCQIGDKMLVSLYEYNEKEAYGRVLKVFEKEDKTVAGIEKIIYQHKIKQFFDPEELEKVNKMPDTVLEKELSGRKDYTNEKIFTIDSEDARDFDDAVNIKKLPGNKWRLGVHIADVSHYVRQNDELDKEAFNRGTSVYLPDRVIPMLPEKLSNGLCSLVPNEIRLTLSCVMTLDKDANVLDYSIHKSFIRSVHRMTYNNVQKILDGDKKLINEYKDIVTSIKNMDTLCDLLIKKRTDRASIDLDIDESYIVLDENNYPKYIKYQKRLKSHRIIEEFMLLANETVAEYALSNNLPFIYRIHQPPTPEKLKSFNDFLLGFDLSLPIDYNRISPELFKGILEKVKGTKYETVISKNMLRAMSKAQYSTVCSGHFGLAVQNYCHFTSPIRRYPDLMVHRVLSYFIKNHKTPSLINQTQKGAENSTITELAATECERDVESYLKCVYMSNFIGSKFDATITSISQHGMYAQLENSVEGLIKFENMRDDYYLVNESLTQVKGKRHGKSYKIGDNIKISVSGVLEELLQIDFELV